MEGHKMKRVLLLLFLPFLGVCSPFPVPRPPKAFLPGECLVSEELKFRGEFNKVHIRLNLANYEEIEDVFFPNDSWLWPTAGARLGIKNVERVEGEYKKTVSELSKFLGSFTAILSLDGESIVADKPFMGYEPGENLLDVLCRTPDNKDPLWLALEDVLDLHGGLPVKYIFPNDGILLTLPQKAIDEMEENDFIRFEVRFPVKVVWLLHGLDLRIETPSADIPMKDVVLYGSFIYQKGRGLL